MEEPQIVTPQSTGQPTPQPLPGKGSSKKLVLVVVLLAAVLIAGVAAWQMNKKDAPKTTSTESSTVPPDIQSAEVVITAEGFSPATLKIRTGDNVTWRNNDTAQHRVISDPHPTHDTLADLDSEQALAQNETFSFNFKTAGTFTYHDELNPTKFTGTIIVE